MLVLLHVKLSVVIPSKLDGVLHTLERVDDGVLVGACTHRRVTERHEFVVIGSEGSPGFISSSVTANDHEATHQEGGVSLLCKINTGVVVDLIVGVLAIVHQLLQLLTK